MTSTKSKNKRLARSSPPPPYSSSVTARSGLFDCYAFLAPNEYSEHTLGLLAFLLRHNVGDINFAAIMDDVERRRLPGTAQDYVASLVEKRASLPAIDASIEKCLMLNRLISFIEQNENAFLRSVSDVRTDMRLKMGDVSTEGSVKYPEDFRKREADFGKRRTVQDMRRLFYISHTEAREPPGLIQLQSRVTKHMSYLLDSKMRQDSKLRDTDINEMVNILRTSFMIVSQPHAGVNPVLIYDRKSGSNEFTAKVSATTVCLLHDFMQTHPNVIELYDTEISLWPLSPLYKLDESQPLSWKTCQLQPSSHAKSYRVLYAELSTLTIIPANQNAGRIHFNEDLYSLKFAIKVHITLPGHKFSQAYDIPLESAKFTIASHHNHVPHLLSKVLLSDMRRFSRNSAPDVRHVLNFILRYFQHRTGVIPTTTLKSFLDQELKRAQKERQAFQSIEDRFLDFLIPLVHQVEFIAKHPILAMFYAEGLFLGICNSGQTSEFMMRSVDQTMPIVAFRMNSIKVDYQSIARSPASNRSIRTYTCAIRVDIYNKRTNKLQYRTFDTSNLANDIAHLVSNAHSDRSTCIRILSSCDAEIEAKNYRILSDFDEYYHDRLHEIYRTDEKYKPITNIIENASTTDEDDDQTSIKLNETSPDDSAGIPQLPAPTLNREHMMMMTPYSRSDSPLSTHTPQPMANEDLIRYALSQPALLAELLRQVNIQPNPLAAAQHHHAFVTHSQYPQQGIVPNPDMLQPAFTPPDSFAITSEASNNSLLLSPVPTTLPMATQEDLIDFDAWFTPPT